MDAAIGAFGEGFADGLADAFRAGGDDDDFAAIGFLELEGFFKGVGVGFIEGEFDVLEVDSGACCVDADAGIAFWDLFDGYDDFHDGLTLRVVDGLGLGWGGFRGQVAGGDLGDVEELGWVGAGVGEGVADHGVAERAGSADGGGSGGYELLGADVADALALLLAEEGEAAACAAAEAALAGLFGFE